MTKRPFNCYICLWEKGRFAKIPRVTSINYYSDAATTILVSNPTSVSSGTYYISYTAALGCTGVSSVIVTTQPAFDINFTNNNACLGFATNYTATTAITTGSIAMWA